MSMTNCVDYDGLSRYAASHRLLLTLCLYYLCRLLITSNSLDLDLARQNIGLDLDQTVCHSDGISEKSKKLILSTKQACKITQLATSIITSFSMV